MFLLFIILAILIFGVGTVLKAALWLILIGVALSLLAGALVSRNQ